MLISTMTAFFCFLFVCMFVFCHQKKREVNFDKVMEGQSCKISSRFARKQILGSIGNLLDYYSV